MSYVMDEFFENLVEQLRHGKLSSGELIQKIDKSEVSGLQPMISARTASIPEMNDDTSFEELCQQAELLLSNAPALQTSKKIHFDLTNTPSGQNKFHDEPVSENDQYFTTPHRSPSFNKSPYLRISRDPLEEIGHINVQSEVLFQSLGKKQFTEEQIEKIRERTAEKRLEKALKLKQQSLMKEFVEYETHCKFQPQTNSTKNQGVKSKYMAATSKTPTHKPNCKSENFTFRPQTTEYKSSHKTKEYLDQNAFSRLSNTSTACQLSSRFASHVTLQSDALLQQKKSTSPSASSRSGFSRMESIHKLSKIPSNLNSSPKENSFVPAEKFVNEEMLENLESIKASPLNRSHPRSLDGDAFLNVCKANENLNNKENDQQGSTAKKALLKINQEFLDRQETFQNTKKERISKLTQSVAASHSPQIETASKKLLQKKFGEESNFEKRSRYFETQKKMKLENLKRTYNPKFQPEISEFARSLSRDKVHEVRMNSHKKAELTAKNIIRERKMKECEELIFHPEINAKFIAESRLGLEKNFAEYVQDLRSKEQLIHDFKEALERRRQLQETIECTHQPQINEYPYYLAQQKELFETQSKNKTAILDDKYASIQKRTRHTGSKVSTQHDDIAEKLYESVISNERLENHENFENSKRSFTAKSGLKNDDHTLSLTPEDLFSGIHPALGDDEDTRSRNIVEEVTLKNELDRLQISDVLAPRGSNYAKKASEIEQSPQMKNLNDEPNVNTPRAPETDGSRFFSFPNSPSQGGSGRKKPPLPTHWRKY